MRGATAAGPRPTASRRRTARPRGARLALAAALLAGAAAGAAAQEEGSWALGGTIGERAFASYLESGSLDAGDFSYGSATALELRLDARDRVGGRASAAAAVDAFVRSGAAAAAYGELSARIRELYAKLDLGYASVEAGRTVVNYGRGAAWSPVDIYAAYDSSGPTKVRLGVDALRLRVPLGATGAFDAVASPATGSGTALSDGRYSLRASGLLGGVDSGFLGAWDGGAGAWLVGADLKADLGASFYGEGLYVIDPGAEARFRGAAGADWSLGIYDREGGSAGRLVAQAEYCYDGDPYPASGGASDTHNLFAGLSWAGDRASVSAIASLSLPGEASSATFLVAIDAAQNAELSLYARCASTGNDPLGAAEAGLSLAVDF